MTITLRPGAEPGQLLALLKKLGLDVLNVRGSGAMAEELFRQYRQWAHNAAGQLTSYVAAEDVTRMVLTRRYWELTAAPAPLIELIHVELDDRIAMFSSETETFEADIERWSRVGVFVVADTSVYIEASDKIEILDFRPLLGVREEPIHLVVPIAVVDELEGLKRHRDKHIRWRAGYSLAVLEDRLPSGTGAGRVQEEDFTPLKEGGIPKGEVTTEVLFDPPSHVRLPIADDEIVARAVAVKTVSNRDVRLLTFDTTMALRPV
jgi:hypothetical protein